MGSGRAASTEDAYPLDRLLSTQFSGQRQQAAATERSFSRAIDVQACQDKGVWFDSDTGDHLDLPGRTDANQVDGIGFACDDVDGYSLIARPVNGITFRPVRFLRA